MNKNICCDYVEKPEITKQDIINYFEGFENINQLPNMDTAFEYFQNNFDDNIEEFYNNHFKGFKFTLKDGTDCILTYVEHECILHPYSDKKFNEAGEYIYVIKNSYFVCGTCLTKLKPRPDILKQYDIFTNEYFDESEKCLFPANWTDEGIHSWCKKRQKKQEEYIRHKELVRRERAFFNNDCTNCNHMKKGECEYGLEEYELGCDSWEGR